MTEASYRIYDKNRPMINLASGKISDLDPTPSLSTTRFVDALYHGEGETAPVHIQQKDKNYTVQPGRASTIKLSEHIMLKLSHEAVTIVDLS